MEPIKQAKENLHNYIKLMGASVIMTGITKKGEQDFIVVSLKESYEHGGLPYTWQGHPVIYNVTESPKAL